MQIDDEQPLDNAVEHRAQSSPSIVSAFVVSINIFKIIEDARWITVPKEHVSLKELAEVLQLNERLDHIEATLPDHLKVSQRSGQEKHGPRDNIFVLQSAAVMIRFVSCIDTLEMWLR